MTEITENTKIKAVAKKTPAKKRLTPIQEEGIKNMAKTIASGTDAIHEAEEREARLDVESMTLEHQERINKVVENNNYLDRNLKEQEKRLNSIHEKNDKLSDKLTFVNDANITIMFPNHLIESIINKQIEKVNNKLMDSINEAQEVIEVLDKEEFNNALDKLENLGKLEKRLDDVEYDLGEKMDNYQVEDEINSMTADFVAEYDVGNMIEDAVESHVEGFVDYDDFKRVEQILGKEINALKEQLNKPSLYKRFGVNVLFKTITKIIKSMFGYNFKSKVRSKTSSIKK